jgi:hypothetical protein
VGRSDRLSDGNGCGGGLLVFADSPVAAGMMLAMNLAEFVQETLQQIAKGVHGAMTVAREQGAYVNPDVIQVRDRVPKYIGEFSKLVQDVEFDVALTVSEESQAEGKAGLVVAGIGAGVKGQSTASTVAVSRVKFTVPMQLPNG